MNAFTFPGWERILPNLTPLKFLMNIVFYLELIAERMFSPRTFKGQLYQHC